jgi:TonB family protein
MTTRLASPALVVAVATLLQAVFQPARLIDGNAPLPAPQAVGWEQAVLRAQVSERGVVESVARLAGSEPLASALARSVAEWRFEPATEREAIGTAVLVAAVYRPPTLYDVPPFRGVSVGRGEESDLPLPVSMSAPAYPPNALGDGAVVIEVRLTATGDVESASAGQSAASGFADSARHAALRWRFQAATREGTPVPAYAYLVFGFRQPVVVIK